jgi:hypothetical protein
MSAINLVKRFYHTLRDEVVHGNPALVAADQTRLRSHYPVMLSPSNPVELFRTQSLSDLSDGTIIQ